MLSVMMVAMMVGAPLDEVLAKIDGAPAVTASQFTERVKLTPSAKDGPNARALVEGMLNDELLAQEGYRQGLEKSPRAAAAYQAARLQAAAELYVEKEIYANVKVDEAQVKALFHENGDFVRLRMIILATEEDAKGLLGRLAKGAKFADEAVHSLDPKGGQLKGEYGEQTRGQMEGAVRDLAFSAPLGKPVGPVKLLLGVAVLVIDARTVADEAKLPARRAELVRFAEAQGRGTVRKHIIDQLRSKQKVAVDQEFLKSTGIRLDATPAEAERVLAKVGGRAITYGAVLAEHQRTFGKVMGGSHVSGPRVKEELVWSAVDQLLLEDAALAAGYGNEQATLASARLAQREAVIQELAQRTRAAVAEPAPAALQAFLDAHPADYTRPASRTCGHLVVKDASQANQLRSLLAKGDRFEELATKHSLDKGSAVRGGLLGELDDRALELLGKEQGEPALAAAMRAASPGVVSEPVRGSSGWHLVRCGAVTPPRRLSLDQVRPQLAQRAWAEHQQAAVEQLVGRLRGGVKVSVDDGALKRVVAANAGGQQR